MAIINCFVSFFILKGLLWALDVGIVNTLEQVSFYLFDYNKLNNNIYLINWKPIRRCSPKIVAINTANNKVVKSIDLSDLVTSESRLQFIVVDYSKDNKPFVWVLPPIQFGLYSLNGWKSVQINVREKLIYYIFNHICKLKLHLPGILSVKCVWLIHLYRLWQLPQLWRINYD